MTWSLKHYSYVFTKGTRSFLLVFCLHFSLVCSSFTIPFHILVCLFSIYLSDVVLLCGLYSARTLWPRRTCFVLPHSVNFPRVHWRLMAGSIYGVLLDPSWRKVPKNISRAQTYLGSDESFEGDSKHLFPSILSEPSFSNILHEHWHLWLMWERSLWTFEVKEVLDFCPCSNNSPPCPLAAGALLLTHWAF